VLKAHVDTARRTGAGDGSDRGGAMRALLSPPEASMRRASARACRNSAPIRPSSCGAPRRQGLSRFDAPEAGSYTGSQISIVGIALARCPTRTHETMDAKEFIQKTVTEHPVVLFMKGTAQFPQCGFSGRAIQLLKQSGVKNLVTINVLEDDDVRQGVKEYANWPTIPQLYVKGEFVGGSDIMMEMFQSGELAELLKKADAV
jgi:monothiol glutaredoxin